MTQKALLVVATNPASEEATDEFNQWYDEVHIPQILERVPGFVGASRYLVHEASPSQPHQRHVAIYEIEADDVGAAHSALVEAIGAGRLDLTETLEREPVSSMSLLELVSEHPGSNQA
jgi:hypothetical protein